METDLWSYLVDIVKLAAETEVDLALELCIKDFTSLSSGSIMAIRLTQLIFIFFANMLWA